MYYETVEQFNLYKDISLVATIHDVNRVLYKRNPTSDSLVKG